MDWIPHETLEELNKSDSSLSTLVLELFKEFEVYDIVISYFLEYEIFKNTYGPNRNN